ncbi:hypothetical protein GCM10010377_51700 [Streptomyces viridiviolaceus]|uniref:Uncharacterized protein n=1 Tax=Streptomyces viridiviolaceus TaxID=68282 RepID=A0ABW2E7C0_9ACTN|nr:hypothetical protein [Streptomyces viridiviolaceus]GHB54333.1 hypothetical protein GCM10010377_51700 [Streptomyces viridiviolaceus]
MIKTRSHALTAAVAAAAALTATGITYAVAAPQTAPPVAQHAPAAPAAAAQAPLGGDTGGTASKDDDDDDDDDRGDKNHGKNHGGKDYDEGWIHVNERSYTARPGGCITVVSGLGSTSLNIRNDSKKTVAVFRGATCDNGAPVATVGPRSSSYGVDPGFTRGVKVKNGIVGSFRVLDDHNDHKNGH